jgi:mercuric ion transport protein
MAESRTQKMMLAGGALAALAASACCLGPLTLVLLGVSGAWIANLTALEPYRPVFIGGALVLVGFAWRGIYRARPAAACAPGTLCALPQN